VGIANTLNRLIATEYKQNGLKFGHVYNKMKNVWVDFHPLGPSNIPCNLADYLLFSINEDVILAL